MGCWHAYAKLRIHTEDTLTSFEQLTVDLGVLLRHFAEVTCKGFSTVELPRESRARMRRATATPASGGTSAGGARAKSFNLSTYKLHALGDYPQTIRERGTTDNYTTQWVRGTIGTVHQLASTDHCHDWGRWSSHTARVRVPMHLSTTMIPQGTLVGCCAGVRFWGVWIVTSHLGQAQALQHTFPMLGNAP